MTQFHHLKPSQILIITITNNAADTKKRKLLSIFVGRNLYFWSVKFGVNYWRVVLPKQRNAAVASAVSSNTVGLQAKKSLEKANSPHRKCELNPKPVRGYLAIIFVI